MPDDGPMEMVIRAEIRDGFVSFERVPDEIRDRFIRIPDPPRSASPLSASREQELGFQIFTTFDGHYHTLRLGSWPRLRRLVEAAGYRVEVQDTRPVLEEFEPVGLETLDLDEQSRAFLGAIRDRECGLWVTAPGDRSLRIADVCRLFPKAPIVVVCQSHREVLRIASALRTELDEPVHSARRSGQVHHTRNVRHADGTESVDMPKDQIPRITVCTPAALSTNASQGPAIAVLADAEVSGIGQYFECSIRRIRH